VVWVGVVIFIRQYRAEVAVVVRSVLAAVFPVTLSRWVQGPVAELAYSRAKSLVFQAAFSPP
jgi:hypothetical protein